MHDLKRRLRLAVLLALVLGVTPAFAQQEKGDRSLAGYGSFQFTKVADFSGASGGTNTTGLVGIQFGKFATKEIEIGVVSQLIISGGGGGGTFVTGLIGGYGKRYYGADRTRPYIGLQAGVDITQAPGFDPSGTSSTTSTFRANLTAGVRRYVTRNGALFAELNYGATFGSAQVNPDGSSGSSTNFDSFPSIVFGFSIVF